MRAFAGPRRRHRRSAASRDFQRERLDNHPVAKCRAQRKRSPIADERRKLRREQGAIDAVPESRGRSRSATAKLTSASRRASAPAEAPTRPRQSASGPVPLTDSASGGRSVRLAGGRATSPWARRRRAGGSRPGWLRQARTPTDIAGGAVDAVQVERDMRRLAANSALPSVVATTLSPKTGGASASLSIDKPVESYARRADAGPGENR